MCAVDSIFCTARETLSRRFKIYFLIGLRLKTFKSVTIQYTNHFLIQREGLWTLFQVVLVDRVSCPIKRVPHPNGSTHLQFNNY